MVVYRPLYEREDGKQLWIRPEKPDNITGQKHRFELDSQTTKKY